ncbi:hypothetical protein BJ742DRAFT_805760 [Cladochytrium replicatum]|nr:hypothetical protein BJ742DRAFT_805760 [Cladochytrium replicatum]
MTHQQRRNQRAVPLPRSPHVWITKDRDSSDLNSCAIPQPPPFALGRSNERTPSQRGKRPPQFIFAPSKWPTTKDYTHRELHEEPPVVQPKFKLPQAQPSAFGANSVSEMKDRKVAFKFPIVSAGEDDATMNGDRKRKRNCLDTNDVVRSGLYSRLVTLSTRDKSESTLWNHLVLRARKSITPSSDQEMFNMSSQSVTLDRVVNASRSYALTTTTSGDSLILCLNSEVASSQVAGGNTLQLFRPNLVPAKSILIELGDPTTFFACRSWDGPDYCCKNVGEVLLCSRFKSSVM